MDEVKVNTQFRGDLFIHNLDIQDASAVSKIFELERIDTCIHLAAKIDVQDSIVRPSRTIDVNVKGTLNLLEACSKYNVQNFVFASSAAVYGHANKLPISEDTAPEPISPYGASKVAAEALLSAYRSKIRNCTCLRFFNVYGEGQSPEYAGVITRFIEKALKHSPPLIYGNGLQTRDFISVSDVVNALILAAEIDHEIEPTASPRTVPNVFNIGTGIPLRIIDLARMIMEIIGVNSEIQPIFLDPVPGDIIHSYADIQRAKDLLKFSVTEDMRSALEKMINLNYSKKEDALLFY